MHGKVIVVDDDEMFRESMQSLLTSAGYHVESYSDAAALLARSPNHEPTCLILDLRMPGIDGLAAQEELARRGDTTPVVFVTGDVEAVQASVQAMKRGAADFLLKTCDVQEVLEAIERSLHDDEDRRMAGAERLGARRRLEKLTARERQVCDRVLAGLLNKQIGAELGIKESTVKVHRCRMMEKLGVEHVVELVHLVDNASGRYERQRAGA